MRETLPIGKILQRFWEDKNPLVDPLIPRILQAWQEAVPQSLRSGLYLERFQGGILHVLISNPVAGQQFQFIKETTCQTINAHLGIPLVKGVRLKAGAPPPEKETAPKARSLPEPSARELSPKEKKWISRLCLAIKDPEVRRQVQAAFEKSLRCQSKEAPASQGCKPRSARRRSRAAES
jgi:hypothetical protein